MYVTSFQKRYSSKQNLGISIIKWDECRELSKSNFSMNIHFIQIFNPQTS